MILIKTKQKYSHKLSGGFSVNSNNCFHSGYFQSRPSNFETEIVWIIFFKKMRWSDIFHVLYYSTIILNLILNINSIIILN